MMTDLEANLVQRGLLDSYRAEYYYTKIAESSRCKKVVFL